MKVKVTKAFRWAREGIYVIDVAPGEVVDGRAAEIALEMGRGQPLVEAMPAAPVAPAPERPPEAQAVPAAPENKAAPAPRGRRGR